MATVDQPPAKTRLESLTGSVDFLPEQVIGIILSHAASFRDVVRASSTCRKWREAARCHIYKLTFVDSDFRSRSMSLLRAGLREVKITEALFKSSCMQGLSICMDKSVVFQAGSVIAWLFHTKKTLRSLTFMNAVKPTVDLVEKLGGADSKLEYLELGSAYIPKLDPTTGSFPSLLSLTLELADFVMVGKLLIACPKLEFLYLKYVDACKLPKALVCRSPQTTMELKSSSLKTLKIVGGLGVVSRIALFTNRLENLLLSEGSFHEVTLVQEKGYTGLRRLVIENVCILQLELGESADSLHELHLRSLEDLKAEWLKYYQIVSKARNLRKLWLCGSADTNKDSIDLSNIAFSFPCPQLLALDYQHAHEALNFVGAGEALMLEKVLVLELSSCIMDEHFARWIGGFLERCPALKRLKVSGSVPPFKDGWVNEPMSRFIVVIVQVMRPFPHIDFQFNLC